MQFKVILVAAMLCIAMIGIAVAPATDPEPEDDCCWEKPCGTSVEQCDKETTFVLYGSEAELVKSYHGYVYVDMNPRDVNFDGERIITAGDIRLTKWHTNYNYNTKVDPLDLDVGDVVEYPYPSPVGDGGPVVTYVDVNDNNIYDLYDGVVYDLDGNGVVSSGDILQTDLPATTIYSLEEPNAGAELVAQGAYGQAWDWADMNHPAVGMELAPIGSGVASDLIKWVDADDSNDWSCADKLYLIQPHCDVATAEFVDTNNGAGEFDSVVTIGDTRVYIPENDPCIPDCGTKVVQGDHDATYMLMKNLYDAKLAYYTFDEKEIYVDIDGDGKVSLGDIRLTSVSTVYKYNTKVKICDEFDLGHDLTDFDYQDIIMFVETDGLDGYTLGDPVYLDVDDSDDVSVGDIRLTEVVKELIGFEEPFVYPAWSVVISTDADVQTDTVLELDSLGEVPFILGYIDSDCTGTWTCPDKLYVQQITRNHLDLGVTIGDLRLYVPASDSNSPFYDPNEDWPVCGTKVTCGDIDLEYGLLPVFPDYALIKFVDRDNDGEFTAGVDHAYIDMDGEFDAFGQVSVGDVRLTDVAIKEAFYEDNTKVDDHDLDRAGTLLPADDNLMLSDIDLLAVVPYPMPEQHFIVYMFDNDCSGDWTCVDALYLKIEDRWCEDNMAVTHQDIRLFIPPDLICDNQPPVQPAEFWETYDTQNPYGVIVIDEVMNAINDFFDEQITLEQAMEVVNKFFEN